MAYSEILTIETDTPSWILHIKLLKFSTNV